MCVCTWMLMWSLYAGVRPAAAQPRDVVATTARVRTDVTLGVPGQVDVRGRRGLVVGEAGLWALQLEPVRGGAQGVAVRLRLGLQRHAG